MSVMRSEGIIVLGITNRRQIFIFQAKDGSFASSDTVGRSTFHINYDDQLDTSICDPAVHRDPLVECVQQPKIMANGL